MFKGAGSLGVNIAALFISYLSIAIPLPVISLFVKQDLGLSNSLSGVAVGIGFLTTIFCVKYAGSLTNRKGGKAAVQFAMVLYSLASLLCALSSLLTANPILAYSILVFGRAILGVGETISFVGMLSWNISLVGVKRSGVIFSLVGASIYAGFAIGGPIGLYIVQEFSFTQLMLLCFPLPLLSICMVSILPWKKTDSVSNQPDITFIAIFKNIWRQGSVVCLQGVSFAVIGAFIVLYFSSNGWENSGFALTFFSAGFVLVRLLFSHFPDKYNGYYISLVSLLVVASGQCCLWLATNAQIAFIGTFLAGIGASLVYPAMGVEVVKQVSPEIRGVTMGCFSIFQDTAYGLTAPITGLMADHFGYSIVFFTGLIAALIGAVLAVFSVLKKSN